MTAVAVATGVIAVALVALPGVSRAATPKEPYYLSLGDSYSVGYQPGLGSTSGYTGYVAQRLRMQLENFGCGGATTASVIQSLGCGDPAGEHAVSYPGTTQEQAAVDFIAAHPRAVGLVTVSIGGNDFDGCSGAPCVAAAMPTMQKNLETLVAVLSTALAKASDAHTAIIGLTYPDVDLGFYVYPARPPTTADVALAQASVTAFDDLINPTLSASYRSVTRGSFIDVTSAPDGPASQGDDTDLHRTERVRGYGIVPDAVGEVCDLTYFCSQGNIHATTEGYHFIGKLIVASYRPR
ncbi:MAG: GDSL-type esterase/lipase family protein [Acidimicrobiales bacterium]